MQLPKRAKDYTNQIFGSLTAIEPSHKYKSSIYWKYLCICGNVHTARGNTIAYEAKKNDPKLPSCGCVELARKTKHGFRKTNETHPAYKAYSGIMSRCYDENNANYKNYGEIGITVCDTWKNNPEAFVKWSIANGWKKGLHIDKDILCKKRGISPPIYSPETCQWVSAKVNVCDATNRSNYGKHPNIKLSTDKALELVNLYVSGKETNQSELGRMFNINPSSVRKVLIKSGVIG